VTGRARKPPAETAPIGPLPRAPCQARGHLRPRAPGLMSGNPLLESPMPITLPENLPAFDVLTREGVSVMSDIRAARQDIRPLKIGLLNLMPKKIQTENQFARLIGATPLQIDFRL